MLNVARSGQIRSRQEGDRVFVSFDGKSALLPPEAALEFAKVLRRHALAAQEYADAERIVEEGALLFRKGIPIGLTNNPIMQKLIGTEAQHNRDLRRYLPGGIKGESIVGTPTIVKERRDGPRRA